MTTTVPSVQQALPPQPAACPTVDARRVESAVRELLAALGHDPGAEQLRRTPERVAEFAVEAMRGGRPVASIPPAARIPAPGPGPVVLDRIPFRSVCEHHLLPFTGAVTIVYEPADWIVGLGRLTRLVDEAAARLQLQERFAQQIVDAVQTTVRPAGALVLTVATHACLRALGDGGPGTTCTAIAAEGRYGEGAGRAEALALVAAARG